MASGLARTSSSSLRSVTWGLFLVQVFLSACLPGGAIFGLNVKLLLTGILLLAFVLDLTVNNRPFSHGEIIFIAAVTVSLCFWTLLGLGTGQAEAGQALAQLRGIASAIAYAWLCFFAIRRNLVTPERLITVIIYGILAMSAVKVALVAASFFVPIDPVRIVQAIFGEDALVTHPILFGLVRLDFAEDILGAFAIFAVLAPSVSGVHFGRMSKLGICTVVALGSGFLAYSRATWFIYIASIFAAMIVQRNWKTMAVTMLAVLILGVAFYNVFDLIFEERFVSDAESSDIGRIEQARGLMGEVEARPFLGKGMGAHFATDSRDIKQKFTYELEWLGFLMQFGIVGEMGILLIVAVSARDLLGAKHPAKPWVLLLFLLWLLDSWTNPHITSAFAGVTFGLFMAMFYRMRYSYFPGAEMVSIAAVAH